MQPGIKFIAGEPRRWRRSGHILRLADLLEAVVLHDCYAVGEGECLIWSCVT
jgi:hypothetical protein